MIKLEGQDFAEAFGEVATIVEGRYGRIVKVSSTPHFDTLTKGTDLRGGVYVAKVQKKSALRVSEQDFIFHTRTTLNLPDHENVIKVFACFEEQDCYYTLLDLCKGDDLCNVFFKRRPSDGQPGTELSMADLNRRKILEMESRSVMRQVLSGLQHLHVLELVHRDVKLENFVYANRVELAELYNGRGGGENVKLIDFDFLEQCTGAPQRMALGTDGYIAPEVYQGQITVKSDVYSAGVVMYAMLTGHMPYPEMWTTDVLVSSPAVQAIPERMAKHEVRFARRWKNFDKAAMDLTRALLNLQVEQRPDCAEALQHAWFHDQSATSSEETASPRTVEVLIDQPVCVL
jgi:calcium-dependent protein kinase